jgi:hypothetical protein
VRRDLGALMMRLSLFQQHHKDLSSVCGTVHVVTVLLGKDGRWMEGGIVDALPLGELQQGKLEVKPNDVRLEGSDMHATAQHVLLNTVPFLSNIIPFRGMLPGDTFLL